MPKTSGGMMASAAWGNTARPSVCRGLAPMVGCDLTAYAHMSVAVVVQPLLQTRSPGREGGGRGGNACAVQSPQGRIVWLPGVRLRRLYNRHASTRHLSPTVAERRATPGVLGFLTPYMPGCDHPRISPGSTAT